MGERELKGVVKPVVIHVVLPKELSERWSELQDEPGSPAVLVSPVRESHPSLGAATHAFDAGRLSLAQDLEGCPFRNSTQGSSSRSSSRTSVLGLVKKTSLLRLGLTRSSATCATVRRVFRESGVGEVGAL
eukprot:Hpha_TRINITY_DN16923_c4_g3::TRINITY_DN16923_c4_g3_i9::g.52291::m.52291